MSPHPLARSIGRAQRLSAYVKPQPGAPLATGQIGLLPLAYGGDGCGTCPQRQWERLLASMAEEQAAAEVAT